MIRSLHIQTFRCLRDVQVNLGPLTALVGPNASGKSTILDALRPDLALTPADSWQGGGKGAPRIEYSFDSGKPSTKTFQRRVDRSARRRTAGRGRAPVPRCVPRSRTGPRPSVPRSRPS